MRLAICAMGRLRGGPEKFLVDDYLARCGRTGRAVGLGPATLVEIDDRKSAGKAAEGEALLRALPTGATVCALDERGESMTSPAFAERLARWRDAGVQDVAFVIGGADGLDRAVLDRAALTLSFGRMVWPHMLARVMLAEQLYRAAGILAGTPYHRE
ncbi:23S rRNA (pseudouridine(1915)-N(3))-methyltransferase RlmH [Palleronia sp. KMU-117]|uniref:23S rRNA (pseudouridine(1915)-N(3))-methyltransferase RlmH n=1 Tax=Palleronia sp. KMU-117 TaxID=3434108 RepID=UPI003D7222D9